MTAQAQGVLDLFRSRGAYLEGHFRLTSGLHSSAYLQSELTFRTVLEQIPSENNPKRWALVQNNLGRLLLRLGEVAGDRGALKRAEQCFRNALLMFTREDAPRDWAAAQSNLGSVLHSLGNFNADIEILSLAESTHRTALEVLDRMRARGITRHYTAVAYAAVQDSSDAA